MKTNKKVILHLIISKIKAGKNPAKISKELNINPRTLQYYIRQLTKDGTIKKESYGVWKVEKEVSISSKAHQKKYQKQIRGHAFNWKIRFPNKIEWKRRLDQKQIKYQLIGIKQTTPRIIFNNKKIWFTKTGLVIYEPQSFFSQSSYTSKGLAVFELDRTIKQLGRKLNINLNKYQFTTSREHYGLIKNELARQYNNKKEKIYIRDDEGIWMWIDDSHSLNELENNKPDINRKVQRWYNEMKETNFEVTPKFITNSLNQVLEIQQMHSHNIVKHQKVLDEMLITLKKIQENLSLKNS